MFKRPKSAGRSQSQSVRSTFEALETRRLMHSPKITAVSADNRGEVLITFDQDAWAELDPALANKNSVQMYEAGANGHLGDGDDVRVAASIRYTSSNGRLLVRGDIAAGNGYRVKVVGSRFQTFDNDPLDGEFNGAFPSGNGVPGGNFEFQVKNDKGNRPTARFSTSAGTMNVALFKDSTPKNVGNFLGYANSKKYDNIFFTRAESGFVIQAGGLDITSSNAVGSVAANASVTGEPGQSNSRGRLSLALTGSPNSGTNEFFFNVGNNTFLDDTSTGSGPFTAFGECKGSGDLAVMDAIAGKGTVDFSTLAPPISSPGTLTSKVPVNDVTQAQAGLNPGRDLIVVRRVAVISKVAAL